MSLTRAEKLAAMYRRDAEWRNTPRGRFVSSSRVSPLGWLIVLGAIGYPAMGLSVSQQLVRARVGIAGESTTGQVTLTASLPRGYGLPASEQGWSAVNQANEQRVSLGERFTVEFPRISYCVTRFVWTPRPAPPAAFVLRFSDAPAEEYYVWSRRGQSGYVVRVDGVEVPHELAAWKIDLGPFERVSEEPQRAPEPGAQPPLWLLRVRFERQPSPESAGERLS